MNEEKRGMFLVGGAIMITPSGYKTKLIKKKLDEYMQVFDAIYIEESEYRGETWTANADTPLPIYNEIEKGYLKQLP